MKVLDYNTVSVGESFSSKFVLTEELVTKYLNIFADSTEKKSVKVPNYIFAIYYPIHDAVGHIAEGTIHVRQKMEHNADVYIGDELNVVVTIKEKYKKKEKNYLILEVKFLKNNFLVCKQEITHLWAMI